MLLLQERAFNINYEIRDPIYGFIELKEWEKSIVDHPSFQRLRNIKQMGTTYLVYPGATHTRFEHSLGVMQYATLMFDSIISNDKNLLILKDHFSYDDAGLQRIRQVIRLAALLHDIGHTPFSHSTEELLPLRPDSDNRYSHEDYSVAVIRGQLRDAIENHPYNKSNKITDANEISGMIISPEEYKDPGVLFWKLLLSGSLDADRGDYLLRDSYHTGVKYGIYDHERLIRTLSIATDLETGEPCLGISSDGWHTGAALLISRYKLLTQVNLHKTRRAMDYHLKELLKKLLPDGKYPAPNDVNQFLKYDDVHCWNMIKENLVKDDNYKALIQRKQIRKIYETKENLPQQELDILKDIEKKLEKREIWYYIDRIKEPLYDQFKEVLVIEDNAKGDYNNIIKPLSSYSPIIDNMKEIRQVRIYVRHENKKEAEDLIYGGKSR